jgi:hypothetical protein
MESMAIRVAEMRASECCPVIGQIEVASPQGDNITSPETELTLVGAQTREHHWNISSCNMQRSSILCRRKFSSRTEQA